MAKKSFDPNFSLDFLNNPFKGYFFGGGPKIIFGPPRYSLGKFGQKFGTGSGTGSELNMTKITTPSDF